MGHKSDTIGNLSRIADKAEMADKADTADIADIAAGIDLPMVQQSVNYYSDNCYDPYPGIYSDSDIVRPGKAAESDMSADYTGCDCIGTDYFDTGYIGLNRQRIRLPLHLWLL